MEEARTVPTGGTGWEPVMTTMECLSTQIHGRCSMNQLVTQSLQAHFSRLCARSSLPGRQQVSMF